MERSCEERFITKENIAMNTETRHMPGLKMRLFLCDNTVDFCRYGYIKTCNTQSLSVLFTCMQSATEKLTIATYVYSLITLAHYYNYRIT